jgi:uncharacterized protein YqgV (UPF0045/DUF77 family)
MKTCSVSLQIIPLHENEKDALIIIDAAIEHIQKSGITYQVGPMETTMEGDMETLLHIVKEIQNICIQKGAKTVFSNVKIIYNPTGIMSIKEKTKKFEV